MSVFIFIYTRNGLNTKGGSVGVRVFESVAFENQILGCDGMCVRVGFEWLV